MADSDSVNVKLSIEKYIYDNLSGVSVDYEGLPVSTLQTSKWIQPRILDLTPTFHRQSNSSGTSYGENVNIMLNINCFVKKSSLTSTYEHYALRDLVAKEFTIGQDITLKDYAGDGSTITNMRVREIITDGPMPESNQYQQYAFAVNIEYLRQTTKP